MTSGARRHTHPHAACLHATAVATAAIANLSQMSPEFLVPLMTRDLTFLAQAPSCGPRHPTGARQLEFHWKRGRWPTFLLFMASTALTFLPNGRVSHSYAGFLAHTTLFMRCSRCSALAASSTLMVSVAWFTLDLVIVDNETNLGGNGSNSSSSSSSAAAARQPRSSAAAEAGAEGAAGAEERRPRRRRERRRRVVCAPLCLASYSDTHGTCTRRLRVITLVVRRRCVAHRRAVRIASRWTVFA